MDRLKVLHVAECGGGVDRFLRRLLKYSSCENIMILSQLYKEEDYISLADEIEIINMTHGIKFTCISEIKRLRKLVKKHDPDIVYAHSSFAGALTRIACVCLNTKVIYNAHGWAFNRDSKNNRFYIWVERVLAHFCDAIVCISESEKKSALKNKICSSDKLWVIENGIDFEESKDEGNIIGIPSDAFVIGMVGRICKQKAPDIFVRMAAEVSKTIKNAFFVIVGDVIEGSDEEKREVEELAKELGINLHITGWVSNPLTYMSRFDIGCLFSRWEGFGLAIPEYMFSGVPIVASNVDAIPFLIENEKNGLLVPKDDWMAASRAVVRLAQDDDMRKRLIDNGIKLVKVRFDATRVSRECEELYRRIVE